MKLTLRLENEEVIDVPDEAELETSDTPAAEIENGFKSFDGMVEAISNLRHLQKHINMFGVTKEMLHLVNEGGNLSSSTGMTLPYYESDDEGNEVEDVEMTDIPENDELVASLEGLIGKAKDNIVKFFKWLKEKLIQFWNWVKGLFGKKQKTVVEAAKTVAPEEIAKAIVEKKSDTGSSKPRTAADLADDDDDSSLDYNTVLKMVETAIKTGEEKLTFFHKDTFVGFAQAIPACLKSFTGIKIDKYTGDVENVEHLYKTISNTFGTKFVDLVKEGGKPYLKLTGAKSTFEEMIESEWVDSTAKALGYGTIKEFGKIGGSLVLNAVKAQQESDKFVKTLDSECNNAISAMEKLAKGQDLQSVYNEAAIKTMKSNMNTLFTVYNLITKYNLRMATAFENNCKVARSMAIRNTLALLKNS